MAGIGPSSSMSRRDSLDSSNRHSFGESALNGNSNGNGGKNCTNHSSNIVRHISSTYGDFETHDLLLAVGKHKYPAHRIVLAQSPVFRAMLYGVNWQESTANEIVLTEVETYIDAFQDFLKYLYGLPLRICLQNVEALVYYGDKYALDSLLNECLDVFNLDVKLTGDLLSALNGWKMINKILCKRQDCVNVLKSLLFSNIELIMTNENIIASLDEDDMVEFLSSNEIVCRTEFSLFKLFESWLLMKYKENERLELLQKFSEILRLPYMHVQEMSYVENCPKRLFSDKTSTNFKLATSTIKALLCDAYKYHVVVKAKRSSVMALPNYRLYLDGALCMKYRLLNTDGLNSWSKMDSYFKVKNSMSQADSGGREFGFCVTLMRKMFVHRQMLVSNTEKQRLSVLSLEISQNFCGTVPFKSGVIYIHEKRAGSILRRPLTSFDFANSRMKSDIKLEDVNFEDVIVKNSPYQYDDDLGNLVYLALDI